MLKNNILPLLVTILFPLFSFGQSNICSGNLGENIFTEGDFGSGTATILPNNPGIAPGYNYNTSPPPPDGSYLITNNSGNWSNIYGSWLEIPDNSSDPNGYMMVVNADFTPGLFYNQVVDGLCENTLYEFSADVINMIKQPTPGHIKPNVSFLLDNQSLFTTGEIPQDERWYTYGFTFTTGPGQTSITLSLRNNAPGGIGNDLALDNISFRPCGPEALILPFEIANICEDGSPIELEATVVGDQYDAPAFLWQRSLDEGLSWEDIPGANSPTYTHTELSSGFYYYRYLLAGGEENLQNSKCRVISNVKIVYVVPKFYSIIDTLCEGLTHQLGENAIGESGIYVDTLLSSIGCDSIVTLDLTIVEDTQIEAVTTITDLSCHDIPNGEIILEEIQKGASPFEITLTNASTGEVSPFSSLPAGIYPLFIQDRFGCTFQQDYQIASPPPFTVDLGPDLTVLLGDPVQLRPMANLPSQSFSWEPSDLFECFEDCLNPTFYPGASTTLVLNAISNKGCTAADSIFIQVNDDRRVYFPTAFSPNGDGINDHFTIFGQVPNVQMIKRLAVFNRWGNMVFEQTDISPNDLGQGWDGTFRNEAAEEGVYVYFAEILFLDNLQQIFSGDVTLLR